MKLPQWFLDQTSLEHATGMGIPKPRKLKQPAFMGALHDPKKRAKETSVAKASRAWDFAQGPFKQLPATAAMAYFSGNSLQIITISMVVYGLLISPVMQILGSYRAFAPFRTKANSGSVLRAQIVYICACLLAISVGVWKVGQMGLLPTHKSDWLAWEQVKTRQSVMGVKGAL